MHDPSGHRDPAGDSDGLVWPTVGVVLGVTLGCGAGVGVGECVGLPVGRGVGGCVQRQVGAGVGTGGVGFGRLEGVRLGRAAAGAEVATAADTAADGVALGDERAVGLAEAEVEELTTGRPAGPEPSESNASSPPATA